MGMKVFANGKDVAGEKSDHWAHVEAPYDPRYPPGKPPPQPKWDEIKSKYVIRNVPGHTVIEGGKIWVKDTECGDPPKSSSSREGAPDMWIGAVTQKINSFANARPGEGSTNVFVEGKAVIRHHDKTQQNSKNSLGIIEDKDETDKAYAEWQAYYAAWLAAQARAESKSKGKAKGEEPKKEAPEKPPEKPNKGDEKPVTKCTLVGVMMTAGDGKGVRKQDQAAGAAKAVIEIVGGGKLDFDATLKLDCGKHPTWKGPKGQFATGKKAKYETERKKTNFTSTNSSGMASKAVTGGLLSLRGMLKLAEIQPVIEAVTADAAPHDGHMEREIRIFDDKTLESKFTIEEIPGMPEVKKVGGYLGKLTGGRAQIEFVPDAALGLMAQWQEATDWRAYWYGAIKGSATLIKFSVKFAWEFDQWPLPPFPAIVAAKEAYRGLNDLVHFFTGHDAATLTIAVVPSLSLEINASLGMRRYYNGAKQVDGTFGGAGIGAIEVSGEAALWGGGLAKAKVAGSVQLSVEVKLRGGDGTIIGTLPPPKWSLSARFTWDLIGVKGAGDSSGKSFWGWLKEKTAGAVLKGDKTFAVGGDIRLWDEIELFRANIFSS